MECVLSCPAKIPLSKKGMVLFMETKLKKLFDYQRFEKNPELEKLIADINKIPPVKVAEILKSKLKEESE